MITILLELAYVRGARGEAELGLTKEAQSAEEGEEQEVDPAAELQALKKAAQAGDVEAQTKLAFEYRRGSVVTQNYQEAVRWFKKAANAGSGSAQAGLAMMYVAGWGVRKSEAEAYFWLTLAAVRTTDEEFERVTRLRDALAKVLPASTVSSVQKRCQKWATAFAKKEAQQQHVADKKARESAQAAEDERATASKAKGRPEDPFDR